MTWHVEQARDPSQAPSRNLAQTFRLQTNRTQTFEFYIVMMCELKAGFASFSKDADFFAVGRYEFYSDVGHIFLRHFDNYNSSH